MRRLAFVFLLIAAAGCTVPEPELAGRACDETHPCAAGWDCVGLRCVTGGEPSDAGPVAPDAGSEACSNGQSRACGSSTGECKPGTQHCQASLTWGTCEGATGPGDEVCDGKDNDCSGQTDEEEHLKSTPCPLQAGVCAGSAKSCFMGQEDPCDEFSYGFDYEPGVETLCDGLDNDCDGKTDEGLDEDHDGWGVDVECTAGSGDCDDWDAAIQPGATESCNGRDDDCNGATDDGGGWTCAAGSTGVSCSLGCEDAGAQAGIEVCGASCTGFECRQQPEVCNGVDDSCDGTVDEGLSTSWARFDLAGASPASPQMAGIAGVGFSAAWRASGAAGEVRLSRVPSTTFKAETPIAVAVGATGPVAMTSNHVAWLQPKGVSARILQRGLPAGSEVATATASAPSLLAALDWDADAGKSIVAAVSGTKLKVVTLTGRSATSRETDLLESPSALALARLSATDALAVYESGSGLKAFRIGGTVTTPFVWSPDNAGFTKVESPAGASSAIAFHATSGSGEGIYVAYAVAQKLAASDWVAVSTVGPDTVRAPALAALSDSEYLVAWIETQTGSTLINTKRIRWDATNGWSGPSAPTGLKNQYDPSAGMVAVGAAADGQRYMVLFQTLGAADDLVARTDCPAGL